MDRSAAEQAPAPTLALSVTPPATYQWTAAGGTVDAVVSPAFEA